jgi:hypothetical protein
MIFTKKIIKHRHGPRRINLFVHKFCHKLKKNFIFFNCRPKSHKFGHFRIFFVFFLNYDVLDKTFLCFLDYTGGKYSQLIRDPFFSRSMT